MKTIQDEILLVIPYIKSTQGRELELSLTGWRKYCTSPLRIIVIGEYDPCIEGKAEFIEAPRAEKLSGQYMPNIDVARKLDMIYERFHNEYDHFVLANDDEYPVRPFDWSFLTQVTYLQTSFIGNLSAPTNYWSHDMGKTRVILDKLSKPHVNYCNHHPFYFDMETFHKMSQGFDLANNSLIRENLYYNIYHEGATKNVNDIRYGFWDTKSTKENFRKNISNKNIVFMCNSVAGWSEELMNILDEHYNGVGRFVDNVEPIYVKRDFSVIDKIDFDGKLKCKNDTHVLIVNLGQLELTQNLVNSLLLQDKDFDLTIFDQVSYDKYTIEWLDRLQKYWNKPNCCLNIVKNSVNAPLNHIWNWFYKNTTNKYLAYLNNDLEICDNIISHSELTFRSDDNIGMVLHPTNLREYTKKDTLEYEIMKEPVLQGWDFFIRRDLYELIPEQLWIYGGDQWLINSIYNNKKYQAYCVSSPVIHYRSKTLNANKNQINDILRRDLSIERKIFRTISLKNNKYMSREFKGVFPLDLTKKLIIAFTTWTKRVYLVPRLIDNLMNQTKRPDKIVLNISEKEYNENKQVFDTELSKIKDSSLLEIVKIKGENTKVWKKFVHTLESYPNDIIMTVDEDVNYPKNYIENMWNTYLKNPFTPISSISKVWYGLHHMSGAFNCTQRKFLGPLLNEWKDDSLYCESSDTWQISVCRLNGYSYISERTNMYENLKKYEIRTNTSYTKSAKGSFTKDTYDYMSNKYGSIPGLKNNLR